MKQIIWLPIELTIDCYMCVSKANAFSSLKRKIYLHVFTRYIFPSVYYHLAVQITIKQNKITSKFSKRERKLEEKWPLKWYQSKMKRFNYEYKREKHITYYLYFRIQIRNVQKMKSLCFIDIIFLVFDLKQQYLHDNQNKNNSHIVT